MKSDIKSKSIWKYFFFALRNEKISIDQCCSIYPIIRQRERTYLIFASNFFTHRNSYIYKGKKCIKNINFEKLGIILFLHQCHQFIVIQFYPRISLFLSFIVSSRNYCKLFFLHCIMHVFIIGTCLKYPEKKKYIPNARLKPKKINEEVLKSSCGNGRVDIGEECDCGTKEKCKKMRSCCIPSGEKYFFKQLETYKFSQIESWER